MAKKRSLAKGGIAYLIYNVFNALFPFITALYVTRILSSENIGEVSYALNIVSYFALLAFVGIPTYGTREMAKYRDDQSKSNKLFTELTIINTVSTTISLASYLALVFLVPSFRDEHLVLYLVVGIEVVLNYFNISWVFEGREKFGTIAITNVISKVISFVFLLLFVKTDGQNIAYAIISVAGLSSYYVFQFVLFPRHVKFDFHDLHFKEHLKPILLLVVVNLAIEIYSLVDVTMIGAIMTDTASHVTYYKYAHQIQKTVLMFINTITMVVVPRLTKLYKDGKIDEYNGLLAKSLSLIVMLSIPMIIGIMFVSDIVIVWLYGAEYIVSSPILKVLSIAVFISPIGYLLGSRVCLVTDHEKFMPIAVGIGAVVNIGLNIWFIILWGEVGAAIASVVSELVVCVTYIIFSHKLFKIRLNWKNYIKIFTSLLVMAGYLFAIHFLVDNEILKIVLEITGAIVLYFGVLLAIREEVVFDSFKMLINRKKVSE